MIEHLVLFKLRADAAPEKIDLLLRNLLALRGRIPGILDASAGTNVSDRSRGYTHAFVVRFADRAALDAYLPHPAHRAVVENDLKPLLGEVLVVDYEAI